MHQGPFALVDAAAHRVIILINLRNILYKISELLLKFFITWI